MAQSPDVIGGGLVGATTRKGSGGLGKRFQAKGAVCVLWNELQGCEGCNEVRRVVRRKMLTDSGQRKLAEGRTLLNTNLMVPALASVP
jgi:hypothetical protein